ncbi:MAG: hypothetical protein WCB02_05510 [Bradyrhizobium sp.]
MRIRGIGLARHRNADGQEIDRAGRFQIRMRVGDRDCARQVRVRLVLMVVVIVMLSMVVMMVGIVVRMIMILVVMTGVVMLGLGVVIEDLAAFGVQMLNALGRVVAVLAGRRLSRLGLLGVGVLDDRALHALAIAATARTAMPRTLAVGPVFALLFGLTMGSLVGLDQGLTVGDRDLVVVGMDFAEGQEAVAVAAIFDERRLKRWLDPRDLGEVDVAAQLLALGGLEVKFLDAIAADHDNPGLFRMGSVDQHFVWHF